MSLLVACMPTSAESSAASRSSNKDSSIRRDCENSSVTSVDSSARVLDSPVLRRDSQADCFSTIAGGAAAPGAGFEPKILNKSKLWENLQMNKHFKPSHPVSPNSSNRIRIIGGEWRSRMIAFPDAAGLRPTASRVRETLFNWLGQTLHERRCLDLFAGSGALGFEAASRGAADVVLVECNPAAVQALRRNKEMLFADTCRIVPGEAMDFLARDRGPYDIVFLDPPFASGILPKLLAAVVPHLAADGLLYVEWGMPIIEVLMQLPERPWQILKQGKAGVVHFALLSTAKGAS